MNEISIPGTVHPSRPDPKRREKINLRFCFPLLCGASKGFMKALKAFIKPFQAPQRGMKKNFKLIFILIQHSEMYGTGRVNQY